MASSSSWRNASVAAGSPPGPPLGLALASPTGRSVLQGLGGARGRAGAGEERHAALAEEIRHPLRARGEEPLVEPDQPAVGAEAGELGDLGEEIHELREAA